MKTDLVNWSEVSDHQKEVLLDFYDTLEAGCGEIEVQNVNKLQDSIASLSTVTNHSNLQLDCSRFEIEDLKHGGDKLHLKFQDYGTLYDVTILRKGDKR